MDFRWNEWNVEHLAHHGVSPESAAGEEMKAKKSLVAKYAALEPVELQDATRHLDEEMVVDRSRPLNARERQLWEKARRKPGRPKKGAGVKVISVSVERGLLGRSDKLAKSLGVSRAALIERGLKAVLAGIDKR